MAKAHVDPAELRRFAKDLHRFSTELQTLMAGLHGRMINLEKTWQDQEQRKFTEEFDQTMKAMARFFEASNRHIQFLVKKAGHIEEYLQQILFLWHNKLSEQFYHVQFLLVLMNQIHYRRTSINQLDPNPHQDQLFHLIHMDKRLFVRRN